MSYSNITKQACATALCELMREVPFEKITVANICERFGMRRKSFYYHFKDKYDLIAWIFDENFVSIVKKEPKDTWNFMRLLCDYLYENRDFYRKVLILEGQNSFSAHFEELLSPMIQNRLQTIWGGEDIHPICIYFVTDGLLCSLKRWLLGKDDIPPEKFISILRGMVENISTVYTSNASESWKMPDAGYSPAAGQTHIQRVIFSLSGIQSSVRIKADKAGVT
ncbi:MAG: TetR/AcrR family transcriptional regulator C-terminal domain-containing protein [Lachnospiraceae bacterium]|nr:TetR/AcrR family transcriptional regulator C-terminal domain-containing protein [Lachnospiraceae bacterium]